ncbi:MULTISPECIES: C40 family peptidase [unclassified Streptomyces]|uniref:C40 family peptidase n=1 Tax=unclassified Streptomyces TaxID=2593676 RepID=UPI00225C0975|nr:MULTISPECIES: C40 family peptidase [unclassified Streptomyces]WSU20271.1 C40 family peptidase [Streptomyces sp. NBC_01108]MCX4790958.1 C40 family peptidase [Streptomyces sp. NBC_01221]MCX4793317.1 C40 family peptidase [Streptomyces sp. NBC_01242]WSJ34757.1 C40 family peptidase [Streptomyces sp. NBC_01321]WSP61199.1 C40 family peptidase [Streptomyces sp. NBC_01240]
MASHRRPKQPSRTRVTVLTATAAAAVALTSQAAHADPKPTKSEVKAKVDKLYHEAEAATEQYNGAKEKQKKLEKEVSALQDKVARGQQEINTLRSGLGSLAAAQYRSGGIDPSVQLFLASDPDSFLDQASALDQLTAKQTDSLAKIQEKQRVLAQERKEAQDKLGNLADVRKTLGEKKKKQQAKLAEAREVLNTLTQAERDKMRADDLRASRAAGNRVDLGNGAPASGLGNGAPAPGLGNEAPASGLGAAALQAAHTRLGMPYSPSATGPGSFDCSGLTQWAYAQAGAQITRTTYTQINQGTRIARSQLKPGDLVFFNNTTHVGLYAGNNTVLHAPYSGTYVRYESMNTIGGFQAAVRI